MREILASQIDLRTDGLGYAPVDELPDGHRYFRFQQKVNAGGSPMDQVVEANLEKHGHESRDETEGPNPIRELQPHDVRRGQR